MLSANNGLIHPTSRHNHIRASTFIISPTLFPFGIQHSTGLCNSLDYACFVLTYSRIMSYISTRQCLANATCTPTQQLLQVFLAYITLIKITTFGYLMGTYVQCVTNSAVPNRVAVVILTLEAGSLPLKTLLFHACLAIA